MAKTQFTLTDYKLANELRNIGCTLQSIEGRWNYFNDDGSLGDLSSRHLNDDKAPEIPLELARKYLREEEHVDINITLDFKSGERLFKANIYYLDSDRNLCIAKMNISDEDGNKIEGMKSHCKLLELSLFSACQLIQENKL